MKVMNYNEASEIKKKELVGNELCEYEKIRLANIGEREEMFKQLRIDEAKTKVSNAFMTKQNKNPISIGLSEHKEDCDSEEDPEWLPPIVQETISSATEQPVQGLASEKREKQIQNNRPHRERKKTDHLEYHHFDRPATNELEKKRKKNPKGAIIPQSVWAAVISPRFGAIQCPIETMRSDLNKPPVTSKPNTQTRKLPDWMATASGKTEMAKKKMKTNSLFK